MKSLNGSALLATALALTVACGKAETPSAGELEVTSSDNYGDGTQDIPAAEVGAAIPAEESKSKTAVFRVLEDESGIILEAVPSDADLAALELELRYAALQEPVGALDSELAEGEPDTFAGLWIEHEPKFKVVVRFTRDGEETIRPYIAGKPFAAAVEVMSASTTVVELDRVQAEVGRVAADLGIRFASGTNVYENRVELYVLDPEALGTALDEAGVHLPEHVVVVGVDEMDTAG